MLTGEKKKLITEAMNIKANSPLISLIAFIPSLNSVKKGGRSFLASFEIEGIFMKINGMAAIAKVIKSIHIVRLIPSTPNKTAPKAGPPTFIIPLIRYPNPFILLKCFWGTIVGTIAPTVGV